MTEEDQQQMVVVTPYNAPYNPFRFSPVLVSESNPHDRMLFVEWPLFGSLLFENTVSDARDQAANERTFLSSLRLSMYIATVSVAIISSFHLKHEPSDTERKIALPAGIIFWLLSLTLLVASTANYAGTVTQYTRNHALVQHGWISHLVFTIVAIAIIGACFMFLLINPE